MNTQNSTSNEKHHGKIFPKDMNNGNQAVPLNKQEVC